MAANPRDERRRRIMNRGADRLALITGRIQSLPSTSSSKTNDLSAHPSFPPADSDVSCHSAGEVDETLKMSSAGEFRHKRNMWSELGDVHRISVAISASEISRVWCSLMVGVIASLMHSGLLPILGGRDLVKNAIFCRPILLVVLITNLTIFLSHVLLDPSKARNQEEDTTEKDSEEGIDMAAAERVSKFMGVGLLLQKVVDAVFMDCSLYSLVLVCALSLCSRCTPPTSCPKIFG